jgi:hypothetical protein
MKRLFSLILAVAMLTVFAVPAAVASAPFSFTLSMVGNPTLTPGTTFEMQVNIANPGTVSIGAISHLMISFDSSVLEWNFPGTYNREVSSTWPFTAGIAALPLNAPEEVFNDTTSSRPFNAHFNFNVEAPDLYPNGFNLANGTLLTLRLRVKSGATGGNTNVRLFFGSAAENTPEFIGNVVDATNGAVEFGLGTGFTMTNSGNAAVPIQTDTCPINPCTCGARPNFGRVRGAENIIADDLSLLARYVAITNPTDKAAHVTNRGLNYANMHVRGASTITADDLSVLARYVASGAMQPAEREALLGRAWVHP